MIKVVPYDKSLKQDWDDFVIRSKNGTFLFLRDYMDYHADRFEDISLLFYDDDHLLALLPATLHGEEVISHGGLTYGGVVTGARMTMSKMLDVFTVMKDYLAGQGIVKLIYKAIPHIYHRSPADEDIYALFRNGAQLCRVDVSTTIDLAMPLAFSKGRKQSLSKAHKTSLVVRKTEDYISFWRIITCILEEKYGTRPTHRLDEIQMLAKCFTDHIALFGAYQNEEMLAGALVYDCGRVVHTQYLGANDHGQQIGALDLVIEYLVKEAYSDRCCFDFGISSESHGLNLNEGLIGYKERFGGRAVAHCFYELSL